MEPHGVESYREIAWTFQDLRITLCKDMKGFVVVIPTQASKGSRVCVLSSYWHSSILDATRVNPSPSYLRHPPTRPLRSVRSYVRAFILQVARLSFCPYVWSPSRRFVGSHPLQLHIPVLLCDVKETLDIQAYLCSAQPLRLSSARGGQQTKSHVAMVKSTLTILIFSCLKVSKLKTNGAHRCCLHQTNCKPEGSLKTSW